MAENTRPVDALLQLVRAQLLDVNTCLPGVIVSYEGGRARVKPSVNKLFEDGSVVEYPIIPNARVLWPTFGGAGVKGPVRPGDPCLLVFAQQATDNSDDRRQFDLQDCFAVMCSVTGPLADDSNNDDLILFNGAASIKLKASGEIEVNGNVTNNGTITATENITAPVVIGTTNVTFGGKSGLTHTHSGVQPGAGNTGPPT